MSLVGLVVITVGNAVEMIFRTRSISQVVNAVIGWDSVAVADIHTGRTWPNECFGNKGMH